MDDRGPEPESNRAFLNPDLPEPDSRPTHRAKVSEPGRDRDPSRRYGGGGPNSMWAGGPGLWEGFAWVFLFLVLQVVGTLAVWTGLAIDQGLTPQQALDLDLAQLDDDTKLAAMTVPVLLSFLVLIPCGWWRMSPDTLEKLGRARVPGSTWVVVVSLMMPLTVVADGLFRLAEPIHLVLMNEMGLSGLETADVHETLRDLSGASLGLTILMIAVVPAIGEEFLFRGLLGRGLIARYGTPLGVGITSLLFAAVHVYPPHVVAILPVGLALHLVYLATGNFAAPVLFHFLNNALAAVQIRGRAETEGAGASWLIVIFCGAYILQGLVWLRQAKWRNRHVEDDPCVPNDEVADSWSAPRETSTVAAVSPTATICAILMLLFSAALFAK